MLVDTKLCNVTETIIAMAGPLSLTVIAEGVETADHLNKLTAWQCDQVQGFYIAKPMPLDKLISWMAEYTV